MNASLRSCATLVALTLASPTALAQTPTAAVMPEATTAESSAEPPADGRAFDGPEVSEPTSSAAALRAFEGGFDAGQALLERGEPLAAARTWVETVALLPEGPEHRDNRAAVFDYIAEAYERALAGAAPRARLEEALAALDRYADTLTTTYGPDASLPSRVATVRTDLRARLSAIDRPASPVAPPVVTTKKPVVEPRVAARPWGGLAAGGGAAIGVGAAGLGVMIAGAVRGGSLQQRFDDPARGCDRDAPVGECGEIFRAGQAMNTQVIAGAVIAGVGLVTGTTLAVLAHRRRVTATPSVGRGFAGVVLQGQF